MRGTFCKNEYRNTLLCIDSYDNCEMRGQLFHPALDGGLSFNSVMQLLLAMEELLDDMNFPQSFNETRSFAKSPPIGVTPQADLSQRRGKKASFLLKVLFRQNASWQGSVTWLDHDREESFRSVLELLLLLHSALCEERGADNA